MPLGTSAYGGTTGSVQYLNTGVVLDVKPRVNPGGLVYLEVQQEVSNPEAAPAGTNPPIDQRQLSTQVAVQSGQTVLLGGLDPRHQHGQRHRHAAAEQHSGDRPVCSAIPRQTTNRTELIVLITPQVINNADDAERVTAEYQSRFESLAPLQPNRSKYSSRALPQPAPRRRSRTEPADARTPKSKKD